MQQEDLPPGPQLMESMRSVGYSLDSAIADIVDNSISARAATVQIFFSASEEYVAIVDDGEGMSGEQMRHAMRLAGSSPISSRDAFDLGRFGLGLKTASLSQCRDLTLVSKQAGRIAGVRWSLDHLIESGRWSLLVLSDEEIAALPIAGRLNASSSGTIVLWRSLDRLTRSMDDSERVLDQLIADVRDHLSLVFHRFISGEHGRPFSIQVNGVALRQIDPFLSAHPSTQVGPLESFSIEAERIELRPYTLPLLNKLTSADRERALIAGRLRDSQGFYIYRAMRLVIWGTWFRVARKDDLGKLARVKVDIPNTLDHLWALDIKKSAAIPPPIIRRQLRRVVERIVAPSRNVHLYRGRVEMPQDAIVRTWELVRDRDSFRYQINREHPILSTLTSDLDPAALGAFDRILALLEASFPIEDVYNRLGQDEVHLPQKEDEAVLEALARGVWAVAKANGGHREEFIERLLHVEPFNRALDARELLRRVSQEA